MKTRSIHSPHVQFYLQQFQSMLPSLPTMGQSSLWLVRFSCTRVLLDTDVTVSWMWSSGDGPQETTSPPYQTNLTFQPLTSDSSGEYILSVTVQPSDNSPFILDPGNNSITTYNLVVQCKLGKIYVHNNVIHYVSTPFPSSHYHCGITSPLPWWWLWWGHDERCVFVSINQCSTSKVPPGRECLTNTIHFELATAPRNSWDSEACLSEP